MSAAELETTRREWEESNDRLEAEAGDRLQYLRLLDQVELVLAEIRRRVGGTYTLRELADEYVGADGWAREVLADQATPEWPRTLTLVEGAAFHLYARGAVDYEP